MKTPRTAPCLVALLLNCAVCHAVDRYVSPVGGYVSPFTNWADAATNIQAAIDVASAGDVVWVTNGVYSTGGKVMAGDLTNRVALDKPLTVKSVNGRFATTILGAGATNGPSAVRCAWLTNGATLSGFTLQGGATRIGGDALTLGSGGGLWCNSTNGAAVTNCFIFGNAASQNGGGCYQGTLENCLVISNSSSTSSGGGGGVYQGSLRNCAIVGNQAVNGGGLYNCTANSCAIVSNSASLNVGGGYGGKFTNCIIYFNNLSQVSGTCAYCCVPPPPSGNGNIGSNPQLVADGFHISATSPCRAAGTNLVSGVDIDGQSWSNPPSIGCDQLQSSPAIYAQPRIQITSQAIGFTIGVGVVGELPFVCWWTKDGSPLEDDGHYAATHTTNLVANGFTWNDRGDYQVMVSNSFGMVTSIVATLVIHCADAAGTGPVPPYTTWATAATNLQDAVDVALPNEFVLVTNGIYATGGKVKGGDLTNRVALDKTLMVRSVNGPKATVIKGAWSPNTNNGPLSVRCAWLTNGAILSGFTLCYGATRSLTLSPDQQMNGGGVWGASSNAIVDGCLILTNTAGYGGGGAYQATLINCSLIGNRAVGTGSAGSAVGNSGEGGGADLCTLSNCVISANYGNSTGGGANGCALKNCAVTRNAGILHGGGVDGGTLVNCTVTGNSVGDSGYASGNGGGTAFATLTNCLVYQNRCYIANNVNSNYYSGALSFCCAAPLASGPGNIAAGPQLLGDGAHLSVTSPCRGAGTISVVTGVDIDGQAWANPPAIGCDEWLPAAVIASQPKAWVTGRPLVLNVGGAVVAGQEPFSFAWFKDGGALSDDSHYSSTHSTNLLVNGFGLGDAGGYQVVASNSFGVATSAVVQAIVRCVDVANASPAPPYTNWATAATNIQNAIDASDEGDFILVTNGVYASGGKVTQGDLTNRVALDKRLTVASVNGASATSIQGAWDPTTTNGPLAVRCAYLADGATLNGFTLRDGATRTTTGISGGGAWAASSGATLAYCVLSNNAAYLQGGGCYQGVLLNCLLVGNKSWDSGGGATFARLTNCLVRENSTKLNGGGVYSCTLANSTVVSNYSGSSSGGVFLQPGNYWVNSVVYFNTSKFSPNPNWSGTVSSPTDVSYNCTTPALPASTVGNIIDDPQLVDSVHLAVTSPCRGVGSSAHTFGTDLDGDAWLSPPSMGCDEVLVSALVGPLAVAIDAPQTNTLPNRSIPLTGRITGRAARLEWSFADGPSVTNASYITSHAWTNPGDYTVTFTAFNTDNSAGVSTNLLVHVLPLDAPTLTVSGFSGTNFLFQFTSQNGASNFIEYATNLTAPITWLTLQSLTSTGGVVLVTDTTPTNATRFYRLRVQ